jgi:zinc transporter ZupT
MGKPHCILGLRVFSYLLAITVVAILSAACGVLLESVHKLSRRMVPFSGGVLIGVALFWVLPEMAEFFRWPMAIAWIAAGFALLWFVDRFVYAVCPACSHTHEHEHCETRLHGFAGPLLAAAAVHSAMDGWTVSAAHSVSGFGTAFITGIAFHKIPEGIALGVIARASMKSRLGAVAWCAAAESATLAGGGFETLLAPYFNSNAIHVVLALAGGSFLYLGGHAIHGELRRSGPAPAFVPALTGMAGSSMLRFFLSGS